MLAEGGEFGGGDGVGDNDEAVKAEDRQDIIRAGEI